MGSAPSSGRQDHTLRLEGLSCQTSGGYLNRLQVGSAPSSGGLESALWLEGLTPFCQTSGGQTRTLSPGCCRWNPHSKGVCYATARGRRCLAPRLYATTQDKTRHPQAVGIITQTNTPLCNSPGARPFPVGQAVVRLQIDKRQILMTIGWLICPMSSTR